MKLNPLFRCFGCDRLRWKRETDFTIEIVGDGFKLSKRVCQDCRKFYDAKIYEIKDEYQQSV